MAAGEYVSVSSQADTEQADIARERHELATAPAAEEEELAGIYVGRGLDADLARTVAQQLMARDALRAHLRDELGMSDELAARPLQAAAASAAMFAAGAALPVLTAVLAPITAVVPLVFGGSLLALAALGALAGRIGGASAVRGAVRVVFWGALAMVVTSIVGRLFGAAV
jgi:VIT1/CCC1 family predicted Fe2+/Mn2+ transporter